MPTGNCCVEFWKYFPISFSNSKLCERREFWEWKMRCSIIVLNSYAFHFSFVSCFVQFVSHFPNLDLDCWLGVIYSGFHLWNNNYLGWFIFGEKQKSIHLVTENFKLFITFSENHHSSRSTWMLRMHELDICETTNAQRSKPKKKYWKTKSIVVVISFWPPRGHRNISQLNFYVQLKPINAHSNHST